MAHWNVLVVLAPVILVFVVRPSNILPNRFRLSVYMGYTRSRNHGNHRHPQHHASTMHDDVNLRHQDPHSVSPMHGVMVHNESTPSFVVVTMAIPTLTPIAPQCGDVTGCSIHNSSISSSSSSSSNSSSSIASESITMVSTFGVPQTVFRHLGVHWKSKPNWASICSAMRSSNHTCNVFVVVEVVVVVVVVVVAPTAILPTLVVLVVALVMTATTRHHWFANMWPNMVPTWYHKYLSPHYILPNTTHLGGTCQIDIACYTCGTHMLVPLVCPLLVTYHS